MVCAERGGERSLVVSFLAAHGLAFEFDAMGAVREPVEDGVGDSGVGDQLVPLGHGELCRDQGGAGALAVLEDLEELPVLGIVDFADAPVIDQQQIDAGDFLEQIDQAAVGLGDVQLPKKLRFVEVEAPVAFPACFLGQGAPDE